MKMKLLALAIQIDDARRASNGISEAAMQTGVYGQLAMALLDTLKLAAGDERGVRMYAFIVETGEDVQAARRATEPARPAPEPAVACRHCGVVIEPTEPMGAWIHTGLSIYCPGSGNLLTATPN